MQLICVDLCFSIETLDALEEFREDAVYCLDQIGLEIVEISDCAHLRDAHTHRYWDRKCVWDGRKDISEALSVQAVVVATKVVIVFAGVPQNPLNRLIVYEEVVRQILQHMHARCVICCLQLSCT